MSQPLRLSSDSPMSPFLKELAEANASEYGTLLLPGFPAQNLFPVGRKRHSPLILVSFSAIREESRRIIIPRTQKNPSPDEKTATARTAETHGDSLLAEPPIPAANRTAAVVARPRTCKRPDVRVISSLLNVWYSRTALELFSFSRSPAWSGCCLSVSSLSHMPLMMPSGSNLTASSATSGLVSMIRNIQGTILAATTGRDRVRLGRRHKFARSRGRPPEP